MKHETDVDFVFLMAVLFLTAFLAELAGLASIIGAFIAGLLFKSPCSRKRNANEPHTICG